MYIYSNIRIKQFINIVVHSVEDMNFRVHLQQEFTQLGLDDYLEKLRNTESEELQVKQIQITSCPTFGQVIKILNFRLRFKFLRISTMFSMCKL